MSILDTIRSQPRSRLIAAGGALCLILVVGLAILVTAGDDDAPPETTTTTRPTTTTTEAPRPTAPLTGLPVDDEAVLARPAIFIKIDNNELARPQAGLRQADLIFEERVEGNVSRLAAVFHSNDADQIGPVRSARTTDLELVSLFPRPLFASSGGNASVMAQFRAADLVDIGHNIDGRAFERVRERPAPHNLLTSTAGLYDKGEGRDAQPPTPIFEYLDEDDDPTAGRSPVGGIALRYGGPEISRFTWDGEREAWPRQQEGTPHLDADGEYIAPVNVVALEIPYDFSGQSGRSVPHGIFTGEGRAVVLTAGHALEGRWTRGGLGEPLRLIGPDGSTIALLPGQTVLALVPEGGWELL
jgi:hypothetical protein